MEHCYCYNFTKPSCKLFRINIKDFIDFDNFRIRSVIDPYSAEFKLSLEEFEECEDIKTDKAWFKLMHLLFGFLRDCDVKKKIVENVKVFFILIPPLVVHEAVDEPDAGEL